MYKSSPSRLAVSVLGIAALLSVSMASTQAKPLPVVKTALYATTSKDTPPAQTVSPGAVDVDIFHFNLYSRPYEDAIVSKIDLQGLGTVNYSSDLYNFRLYDESNALIGVSYAAKKGHVIFSNLNLNLKKNQPRKFSLYADVSSTATLGATFSFEVFYINSVGASSGNELKLHKLKKWTSNVFTIAGGSLSGSIAMYNGFSAAYVISGKEQDIFWFNLKAGPEEDVLLKGVTIECLKSCTDIEWLRIKPAQDSSFSESSKGYISPEGQSKLTFEPPLKLKKDSMVHFGVYGKIAQVTSTISNGIPDNSFKLDLKKEVDATGASSAAKIILNEGLNGAGSTVLSLTSNYKQLYQTQFAEGSQDQVVFKFSVKNYGPSDAVLKQINLAAVYDGQADLLSGFVLRRASDKVNLNPATDAINGKLSITLTEGVYIEEGSEREFEVVADITSAIMFPATAKVILQKVEAIDSTTAKSILIDNTQISGPTLLIE